MRRGPSAVPGPGRPSSPCWELLASGDEAAGLEELQAGLVDRGRGMVERTNDREVPGPFRQLGEGLAELDARNARRNRPDRSADLPRRGVGLEVEGVELARSPARTTRMTLLGPLRFWAPAMAVRLPPS